MSYTSKRELLSGNYIDNYGETPNVPQEMVLHIAAKAGRIMDTRDIGALSEKERTERAGAIMVTIAKEHFEKNPKSEYIDFIQHPEFQQIMDLLVLGENEHIGWRFEYLGEYIHQYGLALFRPSYQYFTEAYSQSSPDYFGIFKYPRDSKEFESLRFSSAEKKKAVQENRKIHKKAA